MIEGRRVCVAGAQGMVGSAIVRRLEALGCQDLLRIGREGRRDVDLTDQAATDAYFARTQPELVFLAAAKVGGIWANDQYPADFIRTNLQIQTNVIASAQRHGVDKLLFLGSSCIYPKNAPQPMREEYLMAGPLEPTNEWYAIAKIAGIKMVQAYRKQYGFRGISLMPTNLYGPGDNFDLETSHVLPALIRKFHEAKVSNAPEVVLWGTGAPRREFLHVDDLADATVFLMERYDDDGIINVGVGEEISIRELGEVVGDIVGFAGKIVFDTSKPDGTPRKLLDVSRLSDFGWKASIDLRQGIESTYRWFVDNRAEP